MTCIWHGHLGYMLQNGMEILSCYGHLPKLSFSDFAFCEHCQHGKQTRNAYTTHINSSTEPWDLIHTDVCGPMPIRSLGGALLQSYVCMFSP